MCANIQPKLDLPRTQAMTSTVGSAAQRQNAPAREATTEQLEIIFVR